MYVCIYFFLYIIPINKHLGIFCLVQNSPMLAQEARLEHQTKVVKVLQRAIRTCLVRWFGGGSHPPLRQKRKRTSLQLRYMWKNQLKRWVFDIYARLTKFEMWMVCASVSDRLVYQGRFGGMGEKGRTKYDDHRIPFLLRIQN